jgi:hypothetical protein
VNAPVIFALVLGQFNEVIQIENTGGILIIDLKSFEISFQGLNEFYGPDIVFTEEMQIARIYSRCYALYGEDAVYTDSKGEQQLI